MRIAYWLVLAAVVAMPVATAAGAGNEGVRSRCYKCGVSFCFTFSYRTTAPGVMLRRWRSQIGVWRTHDFVVPNTHGRWSEWQYGGRSLSGYAYMEHYLKVSPHDPDSIASTRCSHY